MIITDEIYAELSYEHKFCSIASFDEIKDQVILVSGFSKAYAMTGWRLGYVLANEYLVKMMKKFINMSLCQLQLVLNMEPLKR